MTKIEREVERIVVLGCAGTGKTTFARRLGERTGVPVICLDAIWQPDWTDKDVPAFREILKEAHAGESWISDGNFATATFDIRLPRATQIVWLDRPRPTCIWRAIRRVFKRGEAHQRANLPKVLKFIWNFNQKNRPLIEKTRLTNAPNVPVIHLRTNREVAAYLRSASPSEREAQHPKM